jgi:hypothetical protein
MNWQERAEKAEAELAKLREQDPYAWDCGGDLSKNKDYAEWFSRTGHGNAISLYAAHVPAVAEPAVPDAKTAGIIKRLRDACPAGYGCKCMVNDAASELERLSALLQSAEVRHD